MGRRKIAMKPIKAGSSRRATFEKRRIGLLKKAMELSILCSSTVSVTIYNPDGDVYVYSSEPYENVVNKFREYSGTYKLLTNDHYDKMVPGKASSSNIGFSLKKQSESKIRHRYHINRLSSSSITSIQSECSSNGNVNGISAADLYNNNKNPNNPNNPNPNPNNPNNFPPEIDNNPNNQLNALIKQEPIDVHNKLSNSASSEESNTSLSISRKRTINESLNTDITLEHNSNNSLDIDNINDLVIDNPFDSDKSINSNKSFGFINSIINPNLNPNNHSYSNTNNNKRIKLIKDFDSLDLNYEDLNLNNLNNNNHNINQFVDNELNLDSINQSQFIL